MVILIFCYTLLFTDFGFSDIKVCNKFWTFCPLHRSQVTSLSLVAPLYLTWSLRVITPSHDHSMNYESIFIGALECM